jgi:putative membrane protein insertion efficiency factor
MNLSGLGQIANTAKDKLSNIASNLKKAPPADIANPADVYGPSNTQMPEKEWTVLVYMEGRERLAHSTELALNKLEQVGSTAKANVVVQATQVPEWMELGYSEMKQLPTRRYFVTQDQDPQKVTSPVLQEMGEQLPLNKDGLADFVSWGMKQFPAKHTAVIIKKHGAGFASIVHTNSDGSKDVKVPLSARELSDAFTKVEANTGKKIDLLSFDSCSQQQLEVAYQVRNHVAAVTGSEEDVKAIAFPYGTNLVALNNLPTGADGRLAARALVHNYAQRVPSGMHSALDTQKLTGLADSVKNFVTTVTKEKVPANLLYTAMMDTKPMDGSETMSMSYNFRDFGSFLERVMSDDRYPASVIQAAGEARKSLESSIIGRFTTPDKKVLKEPTGATGFFPWKPLDKEMHQSYGELDWVKDSGWGQFLDYVFESQPAQAAQTSEVAQSKTHRSETLGQTFGHWGLGQYKKYISPFLNVQCAYTPTCSQFAREAVEKFGLWEGGKMGALRFFSCNGAMQGFDPVANDGKPHICQTGCGCGTQAIDTSLQGRLGDHLVSPPTEVKDKSTVASHRKLIGAARTAGRVAGSIGIGLLGLPIGLAVGGFIGWKSGSGKLAEHVDNMSQRYNATVVQGFKNISEPLAKPVESITGVFHHKATAWLGGVVGAIAGAGLGAVGAALQGMAWGKKFGGLWAENRTKDALGELPAHPENSSILARDY